MPLSRGHECSLFISLMVRLAGHLMPPCLIDEASNTCLPSHSWLQDTAKDGRQNKMARLLKQAYLKLGEGRFGKELEVREGMEEEAEALRKEWRNSK